MTLNLISVMVSGVFFYRKRAASSLYIVVFNNHEPFGVVTELKFSALRVGFDFHSEQKFLLTTDNCCEFLRYQVAYKMHVLLRPPQ